MCSTKRKKKSNDQEGRTQHDKWRGILGIWSRKWQNGTNTGHLRAVITGRSSFRVSNPFGKYRGGTASWTKADSVIVAIFLKNQNR